MQALTTYFQNNPYEFWGFITTLICVWLNTRENVWGWFFAIVAAGFSIKVFYDARLLGDLGLQIVFIAISIYGGYEWLYGGKAQDPIAISLITKQLTIILLIIFLVCAPMLGWLLQSLKGVLPYLNAITTSLSLLAQWMMARKYLENWLVWIFVNLLNVGVYYYTANYLYSFLYFILLGLAIWGYYAWRREYQKKLAGN
ncbi:MAG: nicotinamide riboside transporter PnuC [Microscillaceae bacterium]|jgi:nicotinamide mononucleotide transporter|nr:nicotinamide riboside transporter PnuC [Microscillaceae bacterium]